MYKITIKVPDTEDTTLTLESESKGRTKSVCTILKDNKVEYEVVRISKPQPVEF